MTSLFDSQTPEPKQGRDMRPLKGNERGYIINASKGTSWATVYALAEQACIAGNEHHNAANAELAAKKAKHYDVTYAQLKQAMSEFDGVVDGDILDRLCLDLMRGVFASLMGVPLPKPPPLIPGAASKRKYWHFKKKKLLNDK